MNSDGGGSTSNHGSGRNSASPHKADPRLVWRLPVWVKQCDCIAAQNGSVLLQPIPTSTPTSVGSTRGDTAAPMSVDDSAHRTVASSSSSASHSTLLQSFSLASVPCPSLPHALIVIHGRR